MSADTLESICRMAEDIDEARGGNGAVEVWRDDVNGAVGNRVNIRWSDGTTTAYTGSQSRSALYKAECTVSNIWLKVRRAQG
jgi:hypothetical protein